MHFGDRSEFSVLIGGAVRLWESDAKTVAV
jgi:hypothetical protein